MVGFKRIFTMVLVVCCVVIDCTGQLQFDAELFGLFESKDTIKQDYKSTLREANNEISILVAVGFLAYKTFISSQDNPSCVFTPSCSEFAVQSIQKRGFIVGWLSTFDRLSRCHGLVNHYHYPFDIEHKRYYDPVQ